MKPLFVSLMLVAGLWAGEGFGQVEVEWERTIQHGISDRFYDITLLDDDDFILTGATHLSVPAEERTLVMQLASSGEEISRREYGRDDQLSLTKSLRTSDGGVLLIGRIGDFAWDGADALVMKFNGDGDSLWSRTYGGNLSDWFNCALETDGSGFLLCGGTFSSGAGGSDYWLLKVDETGEEVWSATYGGRGDEQGTAIARVGENYCIAGSFNPRGIGPNDIYLFAINQDGDSLWSHRYGGQGNEQSSSMESTHDGGIIIGATTTSFGSGGADYWLLRLDSNGDSLWSRTYGGSGTDECYKIIVCNNGGYALAGNSESNQEREYDFWLMRVDERGDSLWSSYFDGGGNEYFAGLTQDATSSFILVGSTLPRGENSLGWVIKTTPDPVSVRYPFLNLEPSTFNLVSAFPNPFNSTLNIRLGLDKSAPTRLEIFDPLGRRVADLIPGVGLGGPTYAGEGRIVWDATGMPAGNYFISLETPQTTSMRQVTLIK